MLQCTLCLCGGLDGLDGHGAHSNAPTDAALHVLHPRSSLAPAATAQHASRRNASSASQTWQPSCAPAALASRSWHQ